MGVPWGLGAQVRRHGLLIGLVPVVPGSDTALTATELALMIARSDYFYVGDQQQGPMTTCAEP